MMEMIKNKEATIDEGMFTRKNLGPMACAACQKNLVNLEGMPVDYTVWKGMPHSVNNERLAKYGQGFSKILNTLQDTTNPASSQNIMNQHIHDRMTLHQQSDKYLKNQRSSIDPSSHSLQIEKSHFDQHNATTMASGYLHHEKSNSLAAEITNTSYGVFKSGNLSSKNVQHANYSTQIDINGMLRHHNSVIKSDEKSQFQSLSAAERGFGQNNLPLFKNPNGRKFVSPQVSRKHMDTVSMQDHSRNNQRGSSTLGMSITPSKVSGQTKNLTIQLDNMQHLNSGETKLHTE